MIQRTATKRRMRHLHHHRRQKKIPEGKAGAAPTTASSSLVPTSAPPASAPPIADAPDCNASSQAPELPWALATPVTQDTGTDFSPVMGGFDTRGTTTSTTTPITGTGAPYGQHSQVTVPVPQTSQSTLTIGLCDSSNNQASFPRLKQAGKSISKGFGWAADTASYGARQVGKAATFAYDSMTRPPPPPPEPRQQVVTTEKTTTFLGMQISETQTTVTAPKPSPPKPQERSLAENAGTFMASVGTTSATFSLLHGNIKGAMRGAIVGGMGAAMANDARQKRYQGYS